MSWNRDGFLAPRHRKYLAGEYDFEDHSNQSQFWREVRNRYNGAKEDEALLYNADFVDPEDLFKSNIDLTNDKRKIVGNYQMPLTDSAVNDNRQAAKTQAESVGLDGHEDLESVLEGMMGELEGTDADEMRESWEKLLIRAVVKTVCGMLSELDKSEQMEVVEDIIEHAWPDKERALEIAKTEHSDD